MKTLTDDEGNKYELIAEYGHKVLGLKPLPKQPEEEKKIYHVEVSRFGKSPFDKRYKWTDHQAQLAADAVREVLKYIQGSKEHHVMDTADLALKAITNEEKGEGNNHAS